MKRHTYDPVMHLHLANFPLMLMHELCVLA